MIFVTDLTKVLNTYFIATENSFKEYFAKMDIQIDKDGCRCTIFKMDKTLYKEDYKDGFFPFFAKEQKICCLCDYIIFVSKGSQNFALIIELKRGYGQKTMPQLKAGECFANFVTETVNRVYARNYNITIRLITITKFSKGKRKTKPSGVQYDENNHYKFSSNNFTISHFLK